MKTSDSITNISEAILNANKELKNPPATADNPFYHSKYTPLDDLIDHVKPVLNKYDLFILQSPELDNGNMNLITRMIHISGEWIETETVVPMGLDAQKTGAAITYARRYAISAILNISSESDNDANETVNMQSTKTGSQTNSSKNWPTFDEIKEKLDRMNIEEMKVYWTELFASYNWTEKQEGALKKIFGDAKSKINQDFDSQQPIDGM